MQFSALWPNLQPGGTAYLCLATCSKLVWHGCRYQPLGFHWLAGSLMHLNTLTWWNVTSTSGICHWQKHNGNYIVFQLISGCRFSSSTKFSLCVAQSVSVGHVSTSHVSVVQLQSFGMHQKPTDFVCWSLQQFMFKHRDHWHGLRGIWSKRKDIAEIGGSYTVMSCVLCVLQQVLFC